MMKAGVRSAKTSAPQEEAPRLISERIEALADWRGQTLATARRVVTSVPGVVEEWKWGVPVWSSNGIICTGETYKAAVKLTFAKGASLPDPSKLFNSSLEGATRRAIDFKEGETVNVKALAALVRAAQAFNGAKAKPAKTKAKAKATKPAAAKKKPRT